MSVYQTQALFFSGSLLAAIACCQAAQADVNIAPLSNGGTTYIAQGSPSQYAGPLSDLYDGSSTEVDNRLGGTTIDTPPALPGIIVRTWNQAVTLNSIRVNLGGHDDPVSAVDIATRNLSTGAWVSQYSWSGAPSLQAWFTTPSLGGVRTDAIRVTASVGDDNNVNEIEAYAPSAITPVTPTNIAAMTYGGTLTISADGLRGSNPLTDLVDGNPTTAVLFSPSPTNNTTVTRTWDHPVAVSEITIAGGDETINQDGYFQHLQIWDMNTNQWVSVEDGSATPFNGFYSTDNAYGNANAFGSSVAFNAPYMTTGVRLLNITGNDNQYPELRELSVFGSVPEPASALVFCAGAGLLLQRRRQ
jgi:hypothetical protein